MNALDKNLDENYMITHNCKGEAINGKDLLINDNPYLAVQVVPKISGHNLNFNTDDDIYDEHVHGGSC